MNGQTRYQILGLMAVAVLAIATAAPFIAEQQADAIRDITQRQRQTANNNVIGANVGVQLGAACVLSNC